MSASYGIYQGDRLVGRVLDLDGKVSVVSQDPNLKAVIDKALAAPASSMTGGQDGDVYWDGLVSTKPGDQNHVANVLTGGTLIQYGYKGTSE